jgi:hypothetical protein
LAAVRAPDGALPVTKRRLSKAEIKPAKLQMPARDEFDGPISVRRIGEILIIQATQGALTTHVEMSEYNAWRAFGCLALLLGVPLPPHIAKAIKLGPTKANIGYPEPKTLGERVAQNLTMAALKRARLVQRDEG